MYWEQGEEKMQGIGLDLPDFLNASLFTSFFCYNQAKFCETGRETWILIRLFLKNAKILRL